MSEKRKGVHFKGTILEYPQISADYFAGKSLRTASIFLLSHCHTDHMVGLGGESFHKLLKSNRCVKIYSSDVTAALLLAHPKYKHLRNFIVTRPINEPRTISLRDRFSGKLLEVVVTLIPAGHCIGSVMFLIEGSNGSVLYTGDFRISENDWDNLLSLKTGDGFKSISSLYLDTTFCSNATFHFPSRERSCEAIFELVDDWLARNPFNIVYFSCPSEYGTEYLYVQLAKRYKTKIHVCSSKYEKYSSASEEISNSVTMNGNLTRLHSCFWKGYEYEKCSDGSKGPCIFPCICKSRRPLFSEVLIVRPSTMIFALNPKVKSVQYRHKDSNFYHVLYSMHASMSEANTLIRTLKPARIQPIALPIDSTKLQLLQLLNKMQKEAFDDEEGGSEDQLEDSSRERTPSRQNSSSQNSSYDTNGHRSDSELSFNSDHERKNINLGGGLLDADNRKNGEAEINGRRSPIWNYHFSQSSEDEFKTLTKNPGNGDHDAGEKSSGDRNGKLRRNIKMSPESENWNFEFSPVESPIKRRKLDIELSARRPTNDFNANREDGVRNLHFDPIEGGDGINNDRLPLTPVKVEASSSGLAEEDRVKNEIPANITKTVVRGSNGPEFVPIRSSSSPLRAGEDDDRPNEFPSDQKTNDELNSHSNEIDSTTENQNPGEKLAIERDHESSRESNDLEILFCRTVSAIIREGSRSDGGLGNRSGAASAVEDDVAGDDAPNSESTYVDSDLIDRSSQETVVSEDLFPGLVYKPNFSSESETESEKKEFSRVVVVVSSDDDDQTQI